MAEVKTLEETMVDDLKSWGWGLIIVGFLHLRIPFLSPAWGLILIAIGILAFLIKNRGMFIAIGIGIILAGVMNILGGMTSESSFWPIFGCLQIYWGIKEITKFSKYGREPVAGGSVS